MAGSFFGNRIDKFSGAKIVSFTDFQSFFLDDFGGLPYRIRSL